jgi:hypothetical protein
MTPASSRLSRLVIATAAAVIAAVPALAEPALLKLGDVKGEATDDKHKGEIEIESFSWGAAADQPPDVATSDPQEGGEIATVAGHAAAGDTSDPQEGGQVYTADPQEGGQIAVAGRKAGGTQTETLERATSRGERVKSVIPQQSITTPRDSASGLATGKRQHMPIRVRQGSVELTMPEGVCVAGAHYPAVTLRSGDQAYEMRDVTVASCTPVATAKGKKDKAKLDYMVVKMETVLITG